ncbi:MAG: hypothetical protein STSR0008_20250 [Ignavibacterium sp.]
MTSLPPPFTKEFPADSMEKKAYSIVEKFKENIPIMNDRNRLGYYLFKYFIGEGDPPEISVTDAKIKVVGISEKELIKKIEEEVKTLNIK